MPPRAYAPPCQERPLRKDTTMLQLIVDFFSAGAFNALIGFIDVVQWNG